MNTSVEVASKLRDFIVRTFPVGKERVLNDDTSLLESGVVDSLGVLDIVQFMEAEFGLVISDDEMMAENFESISTLTTLVCEALAKRESNGLPDPSLVAE
jgi:acyl carrier protein